MAKTLIKYSVLKEVGAIFASVFTTEYVELTNNKTVDFIIATSAGDKAKTTITVKAKKEDGEEVLISFKEKIGQTTFNNVEKDGIKFTIGGAEDECGFIHRVVLSQSFFHTLSEGNHTPEIIAPSDGDIILDKDGNVLYSGVK